MSNEEVHHYPKNKEKADAVLKGTALEKTHEEFHSLNDAAAASTSHGSHLGELQRQFRQRHGIQGEQGCNAS